MFLLIGNSANPYFYQSTVMLTISFFILLGFCIFIKDDIVVLNSNFYFFIIVFSLLHIFQILIYDQFPFKTILGEYLRIAFSIVALKILGKSFIEVFIKFVVVFAFISLLFYFTALLFPGFPHAMLATFGKYTQAPFVHNLYSRYDFETNIIVFNFNQIELSRNSGFYWEPGAHGGYLLFAFFFNIFYKKVSLLSRSNIILILTVITTLSTTAYVALFFILLVYFKNVIKEKPILSSFILILLIIVSLKVFEKLDFLQKKIDTQIEYSTKGVAGESRFASLLIDLQMLKEHPLIGTGRNIEMRFGKNFYNLTFQDQHRNNGIGILLSTYGIPYFIFFICFLFYSLKSFLKKNFISLIGILFILLIAFSEDYFFKVFFLSLFFYGCISVEHQHEKRRLLYKGMVLK